MSGQEEKKNSEGPAIKEETWRGATLASAVIALTIVLFYAFYTFGSATSEVMVQRAQAFTPFGGCLIALVTFCAAMWRGVITERQTDQHRDQVTEQRRQNDANEEINLGKVLQEGAKLIGEKENEAHRLAGIASLETLFTDPKGRFCVNAMDLLANFIIFSHDNDDMARSFNACVNAMQRGSDAGFRSNIPVEFKTENDERNWKYVAGLAGCSFQGGKFVSTSAMNDAEQVIKDYNSTFHSVGFEGGEISVTHHFVFCDFFQSKIIYIDSRFSNTNKFFGCNFSDCIIKNNGPNEIFEINATSEDNFYYIDSPPILKNLQIIPEWLKPRIGITANIKLPMLTASVAVEVIQPSK